MVGAPFLLLTIKVFTSLPEALLRAAHKSLVVAFPIRFGQLIQSDIDKMDTDHKHELSSNWQLP